MPKSRAGTLSGLIDVVENLHTLHEGVEALALGLPQLVEEGMYQASMAGATTSQLEDLEKLRVELARSASDLVEALLSNLTPDEDFDDE
jgi:hypothetical protein